MKQIKIYKVVKRQEWTEEKYTDDNHYIAISRHFDLGEFYFSSRKKAEDFIASKGFPWNMETGKFNDGDEYHITYSVEEALVR